jgi:site-specific DNA-methyltransferase (adenine-specific)
LALWRFAPETMQKKIGHSAMFPIELPKRLLKMLSYKDAIILDPFMGAGTTAMACKMFGRNYIGIEISANYCRIAEKRISSIQQKL